MFTMGAPSGFCANVIIRDSSQRHSPQTPTTSIASATMTDYIGASNSCGAVLSGILGGAIVQVSSSWMDVANKDTCLLLTPSPEAKWYCIARWHAFKVRRTNSGENGANRNKRTAARVFGSTSFTSRIISYRPASSGPSNNRNGPRTPLQLASQTSQVCAEDAKERLWLIYSLDAPTSMKASEVPLVHKRTPKDTSDIRHGASIPFTGPLPECNYHLRSNGVAGDLWATIIATTLEPLTTGASQMSQRGFKAKDKKRFREQVLDRTVLHTGNFGCLMFTPVANSGSIVEFRRQWERRRIYPLDGVPVPPREWSSPGEYVESSNAIVINGVEARSNEEGDYNQKTVQVMDDEKSSMCQ
ncbi:hypothetical protein ARMSODRAFT_983593 [Armillaria solidipes]|uniref:Uncharacterized protein n=1 Tax=Armillaria solidipes TaxID=1076256 RepID=A0A2H3APS1_9AGAR|nr:hypothetical protein ARMSODRAFT_983593 [Armillaria solidipes]